MLLNCYKHGSQMLNNNKNKRHSSKTTKLILSAYHGFTCKHLQTYFNPQNDPYTHNFIDEKTESKKLK